MTVAELVGHLTELARQGYGECPVVVTDDWQEVLWSLGDDPPELMRESEGSLYELDYTPPESLDDVVVVLF